MSIARKLVAALALVGIFAASSANATVYTNTTAQTICDLCTVDSKINISTHGIITDLNVTLISLLHTYDGDLWISIIAPDGTSAALSNDRGASGDNFVNTRFDDSAITSIRSGAAPFTGSFRPENLLSVFNGKDVFGTWTLRVFDDLAIDTGTLNAWSLDVSTRAAAVPEPGSLALMGLALAGLAAARRRRRAA